MTSLDRRLHDEAKECLRVKTTFNTRKAFWKYIRPCISNGNYSDMRMVP